MPQCNLKNETCGFRCTGADFSDEWDNIHNVVVPRMKKGCQTCGDHAEIEFKGLHDHVNAGLGKPVFDRANYNRWVHEVKCVHDRCKADGRC